MLFRAIECFVAECPVRELELDDSADDEIRQFFVDEGRDLIEVKTIRLIRMMMKQFGLDSDYFEAAAPDAAFRIWQRISK